MLGGVVACVPSGQVFVSIHDTDVSDGVWMPFGDIFTSVLESRLLMPLPVFRSVLKAKYVGLIFLQSAFSLLE